MLSSLLRKKSLSKIMADVEAGQSDAHGAKLNKVLGVRDLTFMGIAAVIGAGIFSTIGTAAYNGGPGIAILFIITAITCGFSALCYAEFASRIPISGSAYTYAYVSFGELVAWIIGWALILEYAIGNIVVAVSWSGYFNNLLEGFHINLPGWLATNAANAQLGYEEALKELAAGNSIQSLTKHARMGYDAITNAPVIAGWKVILNIPAFVIIFLITALAYVGIKESKKSTNALVIFKITVIVFVIAIGFFYVDTTNWTPFMPNGFGGVLAGVSAVFYAYIGFDAISTTAEECKNPQRDLPRGMIYSLVICTILYILVALILTGMVNYSELKVDDPLAYVFDKLHLNKIGYIVSVSAVVATTSVLLVFQLGQPRIWMSMSRDGLLPKKFAKVHPKYQTPSFSTIITGIIVGIPSLFVGSGMMTDLTSIGTLFAFVLVCFGVLVLPKINADSNKNGFKIPFINGKYLIPVIVLFITYLFRNRILNAVGNIKAEGYQEILFLIFIVIAIITAVLSFMRSYSFIPIAGALCCLYLMIEIPAVSWVWFFVWMGIGLVIYFLYGRKNSKLAA
jgi:amino acid transporter